MSFGKTEVEKTNVFQIDCIDCGRGLLLRGGRTEMLKRRTSVSSGSRWSWVYMGFFWCRPRERTSRAGLHKP